MGFFCNLFDFLVNKLCVTAMFFTKNHRDVKLLRFKLLRADFCLIPSEFSFCSFSGVWSIFFHFHFHPCLDLVYDEVNLCVKHTTILQAFCKILFIIQSCTPYFKCCWQGIWKFDSKSLRFSEMVRYVFLSGSNAEY